MAITKEQAMDYVKSVVDGNVRVANFDGNEIHVNYLVDPAIINTIADGVVDSCFADDGTYNPYMKEFTTKCLIITAYSDIQLPDDVPSQYAFVYGTDVFRIVADQICKRQLVELLSTIDDRIGFRKSSDVEAATSKIIEIYSMLQESIGGLRESVSGIKREEMENFVRAVNGLHLDEKKLVQAIVDQQK